MRKTYLKDVDTGNIFTSSSSSCHKGSPYNYPYCRPSYGEVISYLRAVRDNKFDTLEISNKFIFNDHHQKIENVNNVIFGEILEDEIDTLCTLRREFV